MNLRPLWGKENTVLVGPKEFSLWEAGLKWGMRATYGMCWWCVNTVSTFQAVCLTLRIRGKYDRAITLRKILSMRSCLFIDNSVKSANTSATPSPFLFSLQTQSQVPMGPSVFLLIISSLWVLLLAFHKENLFLSSLMEHMFNKNL